MGDGKAAAMSPEERAAIKARCDRATKGPWLIIVEALRPRVHCERVSGFGDETVCRFEVRDPPDPNADFIAAARTDVPALLAEVERLEALFEAETDHRISAVESTCRAKAERDAAQRTLAAAREDLAKGIRSRDAHIAEQRAVLAAAQADAVRLRAALVDKHDAHCAETKQGNGFGPCDCGAAAAIAASAGDEALREFGRRLIALWTGNRGDAVALEHHLDAVLRGER